MRTAPDDWRHDSGPQVFDAGGAPSWNVTRKLLWANVITFVVTFLLEHYWEPVGVPLYEYLRLDPKLWYRGIPAVWQLWTFGFLHDLRDPFHILLNMLILYFFGKLLESQVGSRRFAWQYFTALGFGGLVHLAVAPWVGYAPVVGASGAVLYTVIACAVLVPNAQVLFFFVPMPLKVMALILVGLDVYRVLARDEMRTASDVHLAGAALGFVGARAGWIWFDPSAWRNARRVRQAKETEASDEERLDQLLERIHREGIHSLSQRDKDFLSRMSKRS